VRAGIALQGVLSPKPSSEKSRPKSPGGPQGTPKQRLDHLFEGFDSGTRRELRAGLRFGEELAKRQRSSLLADMERKPAKDSLSTPIWRGETTVQHTPIVVPAKASSMVEKQASPPCFDNALEPKRANSVDKSSLLEPTTPARFGKPVDAAYLDTQAKERQWQLEREAVSRQIQNAYADQIVIISSDGIDEDAASVHTKEKRSARVEGDGLDCRDPDETCGDIWLAEAEAHKSPQDQIGRTSPDFPLQSKSDKGKEQEKRLTSQGEV
jgi:hypothetical protein